MNLKRTLITAAAALSLLVGVGSAAAQTRTATLSVGFIGTESGRLAERDQQLYQAAQMAVEQINSGADDNVRGISGPNNTRYNLELVYYGADTRDDAVEALRDAANDGVIAVLGPQDTDLADAAATAGTPSVPVLLAAPDAPTGTRLYALSANYTTWAQSAADYLKNQRKFTRIAVLAVNTDTALAGANAFKTAAGSSVIAADITHRADDNDMSAEAATIRSSNAQALFAWTLDGSMLDLLAELRASSWDGVVVYAGLNSSFIERAGELATGIIGLTGWSSAAYDSISEQYVYDYRQRWGQTPSDASAVYFDAIYVLEKAIARAGDSISSIASQLSGTTAHTGVQGNYSGTKTSVVRLMQVTESGSLVEAARYSGGNCATCLSTWWADRTNTSVTTNATFNIGLISANSGPTRTSAEQIEQAARLAVREINEAGGVVRSGTRYTLNLNVYTATTSDEAKTAFQQAVSDGMQVILGPDANGQILPNLSAASSSQLVQVVSATNPQISLTDADDYVLQARSTDKALVQAIAHYLTDVRDLERFATVSIRADYGLDAAAAFSEAITSSGNGRLTLRLDHAVDQTDFSAQAAQIAQTNPQAVIAWTSQPAAAALIQALEAEGWSGVFVYGYLTPEFISSTLSETQLEVMGPVTWWANASDWASYDFAARYAARYGAAPSTQSAAYYDSVYLLASAIQNSGATTTNIRTWLRGVENFNGVQGSYNPKRYGTGELTRSVRIVTASGGVGTQIARYEDGACVVGCAR